VRTNRSGSYFFLYVLAALTAIALPASAQNHEHTAMMSGAPQGIPLLCAAPTAISVANGMWSNPSTWSSKRVPGKNDRVAIAAGYRVMYDVVSDAKISCVDVRGHLFFSTNTNTRLKVVTLMVFEGGHLEIGSTDRPIDENVRAEIVIADQPIDTRLDPGQVGNGIISLGKVSIHGATKTPTFLRLTEEAVAGQSVLAVGEKVSGWKIGDELVLPDTRQLRPSERDGNYEAQDEKVRVQSISGLHIKLAAPLVHDHRGARTQDGKVELLPHVGNVSRNVVVRSENPNGTRGHTFFINHADVDVRYAEFDDLGRTKAGILENTEFDADGKAVWIGQNQIGRYPIHFHHDFGPRKSTANGYQFTLIGNSVVSTPKWGITVHNSSYGLIRDNIVYDSHGAGIVTEDGSESYNVFDHNFALRSRGSGKSALQSGYAGSSPDPGGEGGGFWFHGPNNYIRNNVSASGDAFGFGMAAGPLGTIRIPKFKGADTSTEDESASFDTTKAAILEFSNNEAYGAMETGLQCGWSGTITNFRVWHASRYGMTGTPTDKLIVDKITVLGDAAILDDLGDRFTDSTGLWFAKYMSKSVEIRDADVQGMRTGVVSSPFFTDDFMPQTGQGEGAFVIENSRFVTEIGVDIATAYSSNDREARSNTDAIVRAITFQALSVKDGTAAEAISTNYGMPPGDPRPRNPVHVYDFDRKPGDNFDLYYSKKAPESAAPCHETRPAIDGWVCRESSGATP
jgi:parallel beta-helix repeat protein